LSSKQAIDEDTAMERRSIASRELARDAEEAVMKHDEASNEAVGNGLLEAGMCSSQRCKCRGWCS
jgi:hypothetical protein